MTWNPVDQAPAYAADIAAGNPWSPFPSGIDVTAGHILFLAVTADNAGTGIPTFAVDKPVGETADWMEVAQIRGGSSAGTTSQGVIFAIQPATNWVAFSPVVTLTSPMSDPGPKVANWIIFEGGSLVPRLTVGSSLGTPDWFPYFNGNPTDTAASATLNSFRAPRAGDLCLGISAADISGAPTGDPDTTNGPWVDAGDAAGGGTGGGAAGQGMRMQYKIPTARGDQTLDMVNADKTVLIALLPEEAAHVISVAVAQDGVSPFSAGILYGGATVPVVANDFLTATVGMKPYTNTIANPTGGYTNGSTKTSGSNPVAGNDTGSVKGQSWWKQAAGGETDQLLAITVADVALGCMERIRGGVPDPGYDIQQVAGGQANLASTAITVTADNNLDVRPGDLVLFTMASRNSTTPTGLTFAIPGTTGGLYTFTEVGSSLGSDAGIILGVYEVDTGTVTDAPTMTGVAASAGTNETVVLFTRVRRLFPPLAPIDLGIVAVTGDSITFEWTPNGGPVADYFEVRLDGGTITNVGFVLTHEFTGLDPNVSHLFEVRACNDDGCSEWSELGATTAPSAPINLTMTPTTSTIEFCWEPGN